MIALGLSLAACFGWGLADFLGGLNSRRLPTLLVLMLSNLFGLVVLGLLVTWRGSALPGNPDLFWAAAAAAAAVAAMFMLYKGLAVGNMAIVSPISATGVILPVIAGLAYGEHLTPIQATGILSAVAGTILAARVKKSIPSGGRLAAGTGLAAGSAIAVGAFFIFMDRASEVDPYWASLIMRICFGILITLLLLAARPPLHLNYNDLTSLFTMGIVDALASVSFAVATTLGLLSIVAVLGSLYPVVTVLLSILVLHERPACMQTIGVILALTGVVMISV